MTNETIDSWDHFCGANFLKTINVVDEKDAFVVVSIEVFQDDDNNPKPRLTLEKKNEKFLFDLNVTNSNFARSSGMTSPKSLIGKKIYFKKIFVTSPKTKKEVESLRILKIE